MMKNDKISKKGGVEMYSSPEIKVFSLDVESGFCQSKEGQISNWKYIEEVQW